MTTNRITHIFLWLCATFLILSCTQELTVIDNSFEFVAEVTYDDSADAHRLTLTRKSGAESNQYKIAFTDDIESDLSITDPSGISYEGFFKDSFNETSAKTYTLSKVSPGEHTLTIDISTAEYVQSLAVTYLVEDFSFAFDTKVLFDEKTKEHSLEVTLKEGRPTDTYTVSFTIDNLEPRKTYQETFTDEVVKTYSLAVQEPGEHTVNLQISTTKHSQKADLPYIVNDYSFKVQADIEYDSENLSHVLFLSLLRGSRDETYTISYTVDGGHSVTLTSEIGKELGASFSENFKDVTIRSYDLSRTGKGKHNMQMIISTKDYSQTLEIPYAVEALPFSIHTEMDTSGSSASVMMLTLKDGDSATDYNATILIDGKTIATPKVNFSKSPIYKYSLPTTRPGKHDVSVQLTDGYTVEKESVNYNEPVRHPYLDIKLKYNENSGKHYAEIGSNPYDISLKFVTSLTLKGQTTVCIYDWSVWGEKRYETKTKTMSDSNTASGIYGGDSVTLIDRDALVTKLTGSYELSDIVEYFYDPGSSDDAGQAWYEKTGTERAYYVLKEETLKVDVTGEKVTGVTLRITNNIGKMTINGKSSSSGTTNVSL